MADQQTCETCGAAVVDASRHRAWHAALLRLSSETSDTLDRVEYVEEQLRELTEPRPGLVARQRRG